MSADDDFCAFVVARQAALRRSAGLLTGDAALAQDLVQASLLKAWPKWPRLMREDCAEAYVRRIIYTTHAGWRRRRWTGETPSAAVPDTRVPDRAGDVDVRHAVRAALLSLPPRMRAAVVLRYFDDLSEQQTADALGCSVGTVKSQTAKGLDRLRAYPGLAGLLHEGATR
jgi:RNA polymerase sigma-70 factor (sigma-E family)